MDLERMMMISPIISIEQKVKINLLSLFFDNKKQKAKEGNDKKSIDATPLAIPLDTETK